LIGNMSTNRLIIAAAGSGKTTRIVMDALKITGANVLLTTFTDNNEEEIRKKFMEVNGSIPDNIKVQTWFSFLLQHGAKPYQRTIWHEPIHGVFLANGRSNIYIKKTDTKRFYFDKAGKLYSDKLSAFILECDQRTNGEVVKRIARVYPHIFIDEVQDLSGYDLDLLELFFASSSNTLLVGDPRQGTYSTNYSSRNKQYRQSKIVYFFENSEIQKMIDVDMTSLIVNYRSNQKICDFADRLFPQLSSSKSGQTKTTDHDGIFLIREKDIDAYLDRYDCVQLRHNISEKRIRNGYRALNFGSSKGLTFDRVLIYPTKDIMAWIKNNQLELAPNTKCKFYVAVTRARHSVGIVYDYSDDEQVVGIERYYADK
jgi:DNA helicase II / ATP-dependent DNA helicase PcrA